MDYVDFVPDDGKDAGKPALQLLQIDADSYPHDSFERYIKTVQTGSIKAALGGTRSPL